MSVDGLQLHISGAVVYCYSLNTPKNPRQAVEKLSVIVEELKAAQRQLIHTSRDARRAAGPSQDWTPRRMLPVSCDGPPELNTN